MLFRIHAVLVCALVSACATHPQLSTVSPQTVPVIVAMEKSGAALVWEVQNRFRLVAPKDEERFYANLSAYMEEYRDFMNDEDDLNPLPNYLTTDLLHRPRFLDSDCYGDWRSPADLELTQDGQFQNSGVPSGPRQCRKNYETHWQNLTYEYDNVWVHNRARKVRVSTTSSMAGTCRWTSSIPSDTHDGDCASIVFDVEVDQQTQIKVYRLNSNGQPDADPFASIYVLVKDIKIVALGDSFSAGEGNPHSRWRWLTNRPQAALWLDARCHRSLSSGPSMAAAYLARHNPHRSVTLLHYGCSGASIANGIAAPWAFLETAERTGFRYRALNRFPGYKREPDQVTPTYGARGRNECPGADRDPLCGVDIARSQIEQAAIDLTFDGQMQQPDAIFLSTGGNDLGFSSIVMALAAPLLTAEDLRRDPPDDLRRYADVDSAAWSILAEDNHCSEERGSTHHIECITSRVKTRIDDHLTGQYAMLQNALVEHNLQTIAPQGRSSPDSAQLFVSHYPEIMRDERPKWCRDIPFDSRTGIVPGVFALVPGLGATRESMEAASGKVLLPLNTAVSVAGRNLNWTVVDQHVAWSLPYGYCSENGRMINTVFDSMILQGRLYGEGRPIGYVSYDPSADNFAARHANASAAPLSYIMWRWNDDRTKGCYWRVDHSTGQPTVANTNTPWESEDNGGRCVTGGPDSVTGNAMPLVTLRFKNGEAARGRGSILSTGGAIHPTLVGHCMYAAAYVQSFASFDAKRASGEQVLDSEFRDHATAHPHWRQLCSAEGFGYENTGPLLRCFPGKSPTSVQDPECRPPPQPRNRRRPS